MNFEVPILLLTFNRPDNVRKQISFLNLIKPNSLYIFSDGPRLSNNSDKDKIKKIRTTLKDSINWECNVKFKFEETNLGCGPGVSEAITWFFLNEEEGIIIEDDCFLSEDFFEFAKEMLNIYRNDNKIAGITADYKLENSKTSNYGFIEYPLIWGWATWRRAWEGYSLTLDDYDKDNLPKKILEFNKNQKKYWLDNFDKIKKSKKPHTWDFQYSYLVLSRDQLFIHPCTNLVTNIGFDSEATHTKSKYNKFAFLKTGKLDKPYKLITRENEYNNYLSKEFFIRKSPIFKVFEKLKVYFYFIKKFFHRL